MRRVSFDNRWLAVSPLELIEAGQQHNPIDKISHIVIIVCFNYKTLADELDAKGVSWPFYANPLGAGGGGQACGYKAGPAYVEQTGSPQRSRQSDLSG